MASRLTLVLPDFAYRAEMADGTVEHELCPVLVATVDGPLRPDPAEVAEIDWVTWDELVLRAAGSPDTLSPWCVAQVPRLLEVWPVGAGNGPRAVPDVLLDAPIAVPSPVQLVASPTGPRSRAEAGATPAAGAGTDPFVPVLEPLRAVLDDFLVEKVGELAAIDRRLAEVTDEIRGLIVAGGKRLRPAFVHWGHRATGAAPDPGVFRPAAAVEVLHTFALLHDDLMDRSARRRGRPSAHVALADHQRSRGPGGDAEWFGFSAALLAGDLAHVWADELFDGTDMRAEVVARARAVFTTLRNEVIAGQYLDLRLGSEVRADEAWAQRVALLKSARYTVTRPLLLGAALAPDCAAEVECALQAYGDAVGLAFQMRDDILGLFGDPAETGKGCLEDLREGKRTVLVLRALRLADATGRSELEAALGDPVLDELGAARCREVVADSGALASVEALLHAEHAVAQEALEHIEDPARGALHALADLAIERRW